MEIAQNILNQLGNGKFIAMTGAKNFVSKSNGLQFRLPRYSHTKINTVSVDLVNDVYSLTFYNIRGVKVKELDSVDGVYAEDLQRVFTNKTGLNTSL